MNVIDAVWEMENLGVETKEIVVEQSDCKRDVLKLLEDISAQYLVVKIPSDFEPVSYELSQLGFVFIETMNQLSNGLQLKPISEHKQKIVQETDFVEMSDADFEYMCRKIKESLMFRTDRVARDPHFSLEQANRRYVNWLRSERERGAGLYKFVYHGHDVGFDCCRHMGEGVYDDFLSGIYPEFSGKGLSVNISHKLNDFVKAHSGKRIVTGVSSTNVRAMNHHINNGYTIDSSNYVFVKHT